MLLDNQVKDTIQEPIEEKNDAAQEKIDAELREVMTKKSADDLIPVYLWLKGIDSEIIANALIHEKNFDPAIYEDKKQFDEKIVSEITRQTGERQDYKINKAVSERMQEYIAAKREITKRKYSAANNAFIKEHIGEDRKILYNSHYTSTLIVEATKAEIQAYAKLKIVEDISLYTELIQVPGLDTALTQVGADRVTGTKSNIYNGHSGYNGYGITIGILEAVGGQFDPNATQLEGIPDALLTFSNDAGANGAQLVLGKHRHATLVTSIIIGQPVTVNGRTYEGVVPLSRVYQTPIHNSVDEYRGVQRLADKKVNIINYSGGCYTGQGYSSYDREIDRLIAATNITFVVSAGNENEKVEGLFHPLAPPISDARDIDAVTSPGKALDVITVGNAATKGAQPPFPTARSSSYKHNGFLPNKPDISAPGTIDYVDKPNHVDRATGTSIAAPIVTGIIAQMMQADPWLMTNPTAVKAKLLLGALPDQIRTSSSTPSDNENTLAGSFLWKKSGAGLVNAPNSVRPVDIARFWNFNHVLGPAPVYTLNCNTGQRIRVVMAFSRSDNSPISSVHDLDDLNVSIIDAVGNTIASSNSHVNNVEIIDHRFVEPGQYTIRIIPQRIKNVDNGVRVAVAWYII